jgi:hypothetical protein
MSTPFRFSLSACAEYEKLRLLALALAREPRVRIRRRLVRLVASLLAVKVHGRIPLIVRRFHIVVVLPEHELEALILMKRRHAKRTESVPDETPTIGQAVRWLADLGGYAGHKSSVDPV